VGRTIIEKILCRTTGRDVRAGDLAVASVDFARRRGLQHPAHAQVFREIGVPRLFDPDRVAFAVDHATPASHEAIAGMQQVTREFARAMGRS
jgi:3-isopropylmalate/(R)-2-methylmalate dehydratase large subunit